MGMDMTMDPPPGSSAGMDMHMHMHMHMTFFWGHRVEILFSGWPGDHGVGMYILALFLVFLSSFLVESFSYIIIPHRRVVLNSINNGMLKGSLQTALFALRTGLSYLVMLAVMSFNAGVLLVAVAGHALGFFLFGTASVFKSSTSDARHAQPILVPAKC